VGERAVAERGSSANLNWWGSVVGSGKFDTPCERIQAAKWTAARAWTWFGPPAEVALGLPEDPQAVSPIAIPTATSRLDAGHLVIARPIDTAPRVTPP
jgi:hypothetical protein